MSELLTVENLLAFLTLTMLEIVLGIDNIVFIAILSGKLDPKLQSKARRLGLGAAMGMRILMLLGISWILSLKKILFTVWDHDLSGKHLILIAGGLFLLGKATYEIHEKLELPDTVKRSTAVVAGFGSAIIQIMLLDVVFSIDSVITAVGMANDVRIMIAAVIVSVAVMMVFANPVCDFIEKHPTMKMLALSFLILIGAMLVAEGLGAHIGKGYIYFAMGFSLGVEMLNVRFRNVQSKINSTPPANVSS
ncbi:MAG: TerC family protein [Planctomycetota bacterium]|jgi:predicted tellurium resistance membrane protein TerC